MTPEEANDKHLMTLKAIAEYAKPAQQKNVTSVQIDYAIRKTKLMLVILPQWAAEFPPFNLCRLSAVVKEAGYESRIIDANIKGYQYYKKNVENKINFKLWDPTTIWRWVGDNYKDIHGLIEPVLNECLESIIAYNPTIVGFSMYQMNEEPTKWMAQELRKRMPHVKIAVGGPNVQKGYFIKYPYYDYIVSGEGEEAILTILEEIESGLAGNDQKHLSQPEGQRLNLNNFPMPDYDTIDFNEYKIPNGVTTELSRGCIAKCTFCEETHFWKYRQRQAIDALTEVEYLYNEKGTTVFWFIDSLVNGNLKELRAFAKGVVAKGLDIKWTGYARHDGRMDLEYLRDLHASGCMMLNYGSEAGSQNVLDGMAKGVTIAEMEQNFRDGHTIGIKAATNWIVGFPTETYQDYADTMTMLWRIKDMSVHNMSTGVGFFNGPETIVGQNPEKFNISDHKYLGYWISKDFKKGGSHSLMRVKCMSIFLDQIIGNRGINYPHRPALAKDHYAIKYIKPNIEKEITYEKFDYNIIKTNINPYADSLVNEIWPLLRMLWKTRGGYTATIKFSPELDDVEFGRHFGTGLYTAEFKFTILERGNWAADFKYKFVQNVEPDPYRTSDRWGAFFAQDYSKMEGNPAARARQLAKPTWGNDGRNESEFNQLIEEEKKLNRTVDFSFEYEWKDTGDWSNYKQYEIGLPGENVIKVEEHPLIFKPLIKL